MKKKNRITYLDKVHAIQILSERTTTNYTSPIYNKYIYLSYEMNSVSKDSSRVNVLDHDKRTQVRDNINLLSGLLGVPIWDVSI